MLLDDFFMKFFSCAGEFLCGSHVSSVLVKFNPVDVAAAWGGNFYSVVMHSSVSERSLRGSGK